MRTTMLRGALTFVILLTLTVGSSFGQSRAEGVVVDLEKKPVEGAVVTFEAQFQKLTRDTKTDKKGAFLFIGLPTGKYKITAKKDDQIDTVTADISGAQKRVIDFTLRPIGGVVVTTSSAPPVPPAITAAAIAAITALQANPAQLDEAVVKLNEVITARPKCYDCYMFLGAAYSQLQKFDEAEAALKRSVEILLTSSGYIALTRFYTANGKPELAKAANTRYTELTGNKIDDVSFSEAVAAGRAAAAAKPTGPNAAEMYNSGVTLWNAGKYEESKPMFAAAVKTDPSNALAHYMLGMAHVRDGEFTEARAAFGTYLKLAPSGDKQVAEVKEMLKALQNQK